MPRSFIRLLIILAFVPFLASCDNPDQKTEKYISRGDALFAQEEYVKAKLEYRNAARISPTDPKVIYSLGLVEEAQGNILEALKAFIVAEQQNPDFAPTVSKLVQYFMAAQRFDEVEKRIDHLLSIDPKNATAHAIKGSLYLREKNFDQANAKVQDALKIDSANIIAYSVLAGIYTAQDDPEKALAALDVGIEHNPKEVSLYLLKAAIYSEQDDVAKVTGIYHEIFTLYPEDVRFRFDLAAYLSESGHDEEAEKELRDTVELFPEDLRAKHKLAVFLEETRDAMAAEKEIRSYIEKWPQDKTPYIWLADLYIRVGKDQMAVETLRNLISSNPEDEISMNASTSLANIELRQGDLAFAQKLIDSVLEKDVNNKEALFVRANLSFYQGDYQKAISDLRRIIRDNPKAISAYRLLAEIFILQGHTNLATDTLVESLKSGASDLANKVRLAQLYALEGNNKRATELLSAVTKADPSYSVGWENTARLAIEEKKWNEAGQAIEQLGSLDGQELLAKFLRGQILARTGKEKQAKIAFKDVIKADPSSALSEHVLSALLALSQNEGDLREIRAFLSSLQTDNPTVTTLLGGVVLTLGEKEEAEALFQKAIENKPRTQAAYLAYAGLLIEKGQGQAALDVLSKAEKAVPYETAASLKKANFLGAHGKIDEAIAIYESLYTKNERLDVAANNMAQLIADYKSNDSRAMEKARIAAERFVNSDNPYYLDTLGWVYFRLGLVAQAQNVLDKAVSLSSEPLHPQISYHYGALLAKIGRTEEAKKYLKDALFEGADYTGIEEARSLLNSL